MHRKRGLLSGILLLAIGLRALGAQSPAFEAEALLRPAHAALEVPRDKGDRIAIADVLARFQEVTDWTVLQSDETRSLVESWHLYASGPLRAEPEAVLRVVEAALACDGFFLTLVHADPVRLLSLRSLDTTARTSAREDALLVPAAELARFADHAGFYLETVVSLPDLDIRSVANSLRGLVADPNLLQLVPVANGDELLLQGFGRSLADVSSLIGAIEPHGGTGAEGGELPPPPAPARSAAQDVILPASSERQITLFDLVVTYAQSTGVVALIDEESGWLLRRATLEFESSMVVPGSDFPARFENLLLERGFVITDLLTGEPGLIAVRKLERLERAGALHGARFVDEGSLELCATRPATMFQTVIRLEHADARGIAGSQRTLVPDPKRLQIAPVGATSSLIVRGVGREIASLRAYLETADTPEAAESARVAPEPPDGGGK